MVPEVTGPEYYSSNTLSFHSDMGITARVFHTSSALVINDVKLDSHYNPEIDNVSGVQEAKNLLIAPLLDQQGKVVALLQLVNKRHGPLEEATKERLANVIRLVGLSVAAANVSIEQMNLTVGIYSCMDGLMGAMKADDLVREELEVGQIKSVVQRINSQMRRLKEAHKQIAFLLK